MATTSDQRSHSALDAALDIFRMRQYFNILARAHDVATAIRSDAAFLDTVRRDPAAAVRPAACAGGCLRPAQRRRAPTA
jgi:hypothetical protein